MYENICMERGITYIHVCKDIYICRCVYAFQIYTHLRERPIHVCKKDLYMYAKVTYTCMQKRLIHVCKRDLYMYAKETYTYMPSISIHICIHICIDMEGIIKLKESHIHNIRKLIYLQLHTIYIHIRTYAHADIHIYASYHACKACFEIFGVKTERRRFVTRRR